MKKTELVRLRFGEKAIEVVNKLKKELDLGSEEEIAEVVRMALNWLYYTVHQINKGYQFAFITEEDEGEEKEGASIKITSIEDIKNLPVSDN